MADTITTYDSNKEPATKHDVSEGGIIGAVGGAIVGGLAGGPIGAVIGAVVGGAASAGAVDVVDKHDHDYNRTEYANSADEVDTDDEVVTDDLRGNRVVEPIGTYNDTTTGTAYTTTPATMGTAYTERDAVTAPTTAYADNTSYANTTALRDNGDQVVVPIVEEELQVGKRVEQTGGAHIHTEVIERPVSESVNLREEHVTIDRHPVDRAATDADFTTGGRDFNVTETREVPIVAKEARVVEEVVIGKTASERTETVNDTVRRTDVVVDEVDGKKTSSTY